MNKNRLTIDIPIRRFSSDDELSTYRFNNIGPLVFGGLPSESDFNRIRQSYNIKAILSLSNDYIPDYGLIHMCIPISHKEPSVDELNRIISFIKYFYDRNEYIFIHCYKGIKRTPFILILFLINIGIAKDIAIDTVRKANSRMDLTMEEYNYIYQ